MTMDDRRERQKEDFIINAPISEERKDRFIQEFRKDRAEAATLRALFTKVGAFREDATKNSEHSFGFAAFLWKGPFVEESNWGEYRTWDFAVASERYLQGRFEDLLLKSPTKGETRPEAGELAKRCTELVAEAVASQYTPSAFVIAGQLDGNEIVRMQLEYGFTLRYDVEGSIQSPWILGYFDSKPVLYIREAKVPRVYAVDLARFAALVRYDDIEFELETIDDNRARKLLQQDPARIKVPEGRPDTVEEKVRQLKLHVGLRLSEMWAFEKTDTKAAIGSKLLEEDES